MKDGATQRAHSSLGSGSEFDIVRRMLARWGELAAGIGDDAAIVSVPPGDLIVSTDTSVEDVHFRKAWLTHREIAYRATTAALSDLAAMAATPIGVFLALTLPETDKSHVDELADGVGDALRAVRTRVLGGDVSRGSSLSLTLTVMGSASNPLTRAAARAGDLVYVTGRLGGAFAALREFQDGRIPGHTLRDRFAHPVPRLNEARWLADHGAHAGIDISDGLIADARHVAAASGVVIRIAGERVPVSSGASAEDALAGGEEYELLITSPAALDAAEFKIEFDLDLTAIGDVGGGATPGVELRDNGSIVAAPAGYDHFSA